MKSRFLSVDSPLEAETTSVALVFHWKTDVVSASKGDIPHNKSVEHIARDIYFVSSGRAFKDKRRKENILISLIPSMLTLDSMVYWCT